MLVFLSLPGRIHRVLSQSVFIPLCLLLQAVGLKYRVAPAHAGALAADTQHPEVTGVSELKSPARGWRYSRLARKKGPQSTRVRAAAPSVLHP